MTRAYLAEGGGREGLEKSISDAAMAEDLGVVVKVRGGEIYGFRGTIGRNLRRQVVE